METGNSGFSETGLRRLREVLARHVDSGKIPGLVALVSRGGETHVEAIGTMRHDGGAPMRRDTIFRMASTSKPVAIAAAMVLLDECRLRLDDPVEPWLPELADRQVLKRIDGPLDDTVPARRPITVRDLLTSTFGLGMDMTSLGTPIMGAIFEQGLTPNLPEPMPEPDEWMRRLGTLPLMYQPGERWQYHISNDLLGVLVARVTGQSFETFLRERIFDPLGMKDTGFHVPADKIDRLPPLYAPDPQTGEFHRVGRGRGRTAQPASGVPGRRRRAGLHRRRLPRLLPDAAEPRDARERTDPVPARRRADDHQPPHARAASRPRRHGRATTSMCRSAKGSTAAGASGWRCAPTAATTRPSASSAGTAEAGTSTYADPDNQLTGILLTQVGMSTPDSARLIHDFWTTLYQAIDD